MKNEAVTKFASNGEGPVFAGALFPFVFITIACGALSGFHSLIASGTTPKMIEKETQVRFIGYGAMLMESFVAVMAIIAASIIDPGLYYAMNAPAARRRRHGPVGLAGRQRPRLRDLARTQLAGRGQRRSRRRRWSPAPAAPRRSPIGMSQIFAGVAGEGLRAFWYHFAIMFEALFILTTVDAGTRVGRFMLQDTLGNVCKPFRDVSWKPGVWLCSAVDRRRVGLLPLRRRDQSARRDQPAVPAVRHRQPAAGGGRADGLHDAADQARASSSGRG